MTFHALPASNTDRLPDALDIAALIGPAAWARLSPAIRRRFARIHRFTTYRGSLHVTCNAVGGVFAFCSRLLGRPLVGTRNAHAATVVNVWSNERGGVVWERRLELPSESHLVRSTKMLGADGRLIERTDGGLSMELNVFEENGALVFESCRYFLAIGNWELPIPALLAPGSCRVEHRDEGPGLFRFTMSMRHRWWGATFHQTGLFADPKEDLV
jgi:hypothetical protein